MESTSHKFSFVFDSRLKNRPRKSFGLVLLSAFLLFAAPAQARFASMVVDAESGEVLSANNADAQNYPASLTKMMTLYLLFDALDSGDVRLTDRMPVSAHAAAQSPTKLGLAPGQSLQVEDAILGLCTKSANDAAVTVAEYLGGTEGGFADKMTRKARELGMRSTVFKNASGLPNRGQVSTARDMVTLARALLHNHPKQYRYFSTRVFNYNGTPIRNHNHLMEWYAGVDGIKTGFIGASGFNLVASAKRDGRRLIGVVFGGQSAPARDRQMAKLLDAGFARTPGTAMAKATEAVQTEEVEDVAAAADPAPKIVLAKPAATADKSDYRAIMRAMASSKAAQAATVPAKPQQIRTKVARAAQPEASGDSEDDDSWGIQVGAYAQKAKATQAANAALHKLGRLARDGEVKVAKAKGHHPMYRARVIGLPEETAREACRRLLKAHTSCSVINTGTNVAMR